MHTRIQEFLLGGVSRPNGEKTALKTFFMLVYGFLDLKLFYSLQRGSNGFIAEKTMLFQGIRGGPTFREVQLFTGGIQMLISIEINITCDFPGMRVRNPYPPLDPHMNDING